MAHISRTGNGAPAALRSNGDKSKAGSWTAGRSTQVHDDMNLVVLLGMSIWAAVSMYTHNRAAQYNLTLFAVAYMLLDAVWIACNLGSVKSPRTVLGHHLATLIVLWDPVVHPQHAFYTCCALLVEGNTFLLIMRRRVAWGSSLWVEVPFVVTWVALRLVWYPFLAFFMSNLAFPEQTTGAAWFPDALVEWRQRIELQTVTMLKRSYLSWVGICLFQIWWSTQLFSNYAQKRQASKQHAAKYL